MKRRAYTLVEILLVIGIITVLSAIIFPVFQSIREAGRRATCLSNLRTLGMACTLYSQDNDDLYPFAGDPFDLRTQYWQTAEGGKYWSQVSQMRPITVVLQPYINSPVIWRCPSDSGFSSYDLYPSYPLNAKNSSYENFGTSYYFQTRIVLSHSTVSGLTAYDTSDITAEHYPEYGPTKIPLLFDGNGAWHGEADSPYRRYNALMADGHAANLSESEFGALEMYSFEPPQYP